MQHGHLTRKTGTLHHISRISGQLSTLRKYVGGDKSCEEIAMLTTSISKSFDTLRARTLEGFILNNIATEETGEKKLKQLNKLMELYKK